MRALSKWRPGVRAREESELRRYLENSHLVIRSLCLSLDLETPGVALSIERVSRVADILAAELSLSSRLWRHIRLVIALHDIGKHSALEPILARSGPLAYQEHLSTWAQVSGSLAARAARRAITTSGAFMPLSIRYHRTDSSAFCIWLNHSRGLAHKRNGWALSRLSSIVAGFSRVSRCDSPRVVFGYA